jgi:hypothetical protein
MSTVREARIAAARRVILNVDPWITTKTIREMAENVVDALFPPDPLIDNAKVESGASTLEQLDPIREGLHRALTELVDGVDDDHAIMHIQVWKKLQTNEIGRITR